MRFIGMASKDIVMLLIFLVTVLSVAYAAKYNGRLDMCNEMGYFYTNQGQCVTCEETGRIIKDGKCVIPTQEDNFKLERLV